MFICQYCHKECKSKLSKSCHERFCKLNPDYESNIKVHIEKCAKPALIASIKATKEKAKNNPLNQIKTYTLVCSKCGKEYNLDLRIRDYNNSNYRKTCSNKCAQARTLSEDSKRRKHEKLIVPRLHFCQNCGKKYYSSASNPRHGLCDECKKRRTVIIEKDKTTKIIFTRKNIGLHKINCKECGKEIYVKAEKAQYCYECSDKLGYKHFQIFDQNGKKVCSEKTKKKL